MKSLIKYLIVEDDEMDELILRSLLCSYDFLQHIASATNAAEAATLIVNTMPDVVFMDIDIPGGSGLDLVKNCKQPKPVIIFTTAHSEYAIEGFALSALDYLLKPVAEDRVAEAVKRIKDYFELVQKANAYEAQLDEQSIVIKEGYNKIKLSLHNIVFLEAMQDYTKVVTATRSYMVNMPLTNFISAFAKDLFIRIHRSYAVLEKNIVEIKNNSVVCTDISLPIGKTYKAQIAKLKL